MPYKPYNACTNEQCFVILQIMDLIMLFMPHKITVTKLLHNKGDNCGSIDIGATTYFLATTTHWLCNTLVLGY